MPKSTHQKPLSKNEEIARVAASFVLALISACFILITGYAGYSSFEFLSWAVGTGMACGLLLVLLTGLFFYFYREITEEAAHRAGKTSTKKK